MPTLSSISTKVTPLLPCNFDFIDEKKTLGFVDASSSSAAEAAPIPNLVFAPLPCRSAVQSKRGIVHRSNGRKRETIEAIVGSCISRAVAFSGHQFRAVLKSFQDLSARKSNTFGDVRCNNGGQKHPSGPTDNGNGGAGSGGGSESGSHGEGKGGGGGNSNPPLMGPVWKRTQKGIITRGRTVLLRAANRGQIYDNATGGSISNSRTWLWVAEGLAVRALMEPAVVDTMFQALFLPFQLLIFLLSPEFGNQVVQCMMATFVIGPLIAVLLLWLVWTWWRAKNDVDDDDDGDRA